MLALLLTRPAAAQKTPDAAKTFNDLCSACHSIGGGALAGPDLINAAKHSHDDLQKALKRMEENVGPLDSKQTDALIRLLQSPDAKQQIAAAANPPAIAIPPEQKAASAMTGQRLFYGEQAFANGGTPCFACHAVGGRGGSLAADLTGIHSHRGEAVLLATTQQPPFPLMKAIYGTHAVTAQEAWHLLAFLQQAEKGAPAQPEGTAARDGIAAGVTLVVLSGVAVMFRSRRAGARARMVQQSSKGA
ncbi:MAG TPA: hypothetical protein VF980_07895 [Thermoanaerobaculia bacterium]